MIWDWYFQLVIMLASFAYEFLSPLS